MTIEQASEHFGVPLEKLQTYENQGLFDCNRQPDGTIDYSEELMEYVGIINILTDAGAEADALRDFMGQLMESTITKGEKLRYLRRQRQKLLESIHLKQKSLDQLDYIIHRVTKTSDSV
ncbi:MAG TPA: MerR family transcriptional regulator [Candidatus Avanaerovorax faecigallinarum]|nr:MerR family transcriptional regulator [Candidatus Avanaerovorax faecigallinarum]